MKQIEAFQAGKLQVDFIDLALVQNTATDPIQYRGTGYIRQTEDDALTLRLYARETKNTDFASDFNTMESTKQGTLYKDSDYFTLTGTSIDGSVWSAQNLLPRCSWLASNPNPVVNADVGACERGQRSNKRSGIRMHYFRKADIPCRIDRAKFAACGYDFEVHKKNDGFTIKVRSETAFPENFEMKVEEAIRFLLAKSASCRVVESCDHFILYSRSNSSHHTRLMRPMLRGSAAFNGSSWQLFECYLAYVLTGSEPYWHTCSNHLHNACEASANALDAWAIGLSVAVEGLAGLLPNKLDPNLNTRLKALQDFINNQVSSTPDHKAFAPRIAGMVNGLTNIRAIDRMNELAERGGTLPALVKDWQKLRNSGVHPSKRGGDLSQSDCQRLIDQVYHVTTLMYHIVFALIGYKGPYTDYSAYGFSERTYPPENTAASTTTTASTSSPQPSPRLAQLRL
jgi:hypothetical protein